ncbi:MAG TPA: hypothetical protein VHR66_24880 [Gemmataceae bacterium]|jgi:hypothetical protein|nr:hypothetical protein [Gemmataceae bacterium]
MANHLEALARRLESDPFFVACALRRYADSEGLDEPRLAQALGCTGETLTRLRLCRIPDPTRFKDDVHQIAARFEVNRDAFAQAIRRGEVILKMRPDTPTDHGLLLAARDEDETKPESDS